MPNSSDFSHSDVNGVVSYLNRPVAARARRGWTPVDGGHPAAIMKAVRAAIFDVPNNASAGDLRRVIVAYLT